MGLVKKLKSAGKWQTLQIVIQVIAQFGYMAIMARLLTKADFGLMALALSFIGFGTIFSDGGMGVSLIQRKNINQKHINAALQSSVLIGVVIFAIFFVTAEYIAIFFNQPQLELIIKVIGLNIIFNSVGNVSLKLLQKEFKFKYSSNISIFSTIIGYVIGIILGLNGLGVWSLIIANLIITFLSAALYLYYSPIIFSLKFNFKEWKELFSFGFGVILLKINNYMGNQGLNLVLATILSPALLGVFERTYRIKNLPSQYLGSVLDTIMFPAMSGIQDEEERLFRIYQHSLGLVNSVLIPIAAYLIFFSKEIVLVMLGGNWLEAVLPLQIMFIVLPFSSSGRMADSVIRAKGLIYKNVQRKFIYVIVLISTVSLGAYYYGLVGAAIAVTFSYLFNYVIMIILVKKIFKKGFIEIFFQPIISGLKLSIIVIAITLPFFFILKYFVNNEVLVFIVNTIFLIIVVSILLLKKTDLFGIYIQETFNKVIVRKTKK